MKEIKLELSEKITRTPDPVKSFRFKLKEEFHFIPGQFVQINLDENNKNNRELNKYLSISTSPGKNYIEITKKLSNSNFSQKLDSLEPGNKVLIKGPLGNCTYTKESSKKIAFLIGGIGITPVISIIQYILDTKLETDLQLIYSNWTTERIAFKKELENYQKTNPKIKTLHVLNSAENTIQNSVTGTITKEIIQTHAPDITDRQIYIFGPPKMVTAMKEICNQLKIEKNKVLTENFMGY